MIGWLKDALAGQGGFPSTKRITLAQAATTLSGISILIGLAVAYRVIMAGDVGAGAVAALAAVTGPLAALAGASYRKPEGGAQ